MRLIAMVSWWGEDMDLIHSCYLGMAGLGVTHVVAVDGVLDLYPGGATNSTPESYGWHLRLADRYSMDLIMYRNHKRWDGSNEVAKRQLMLEIALSITTDKDWLLIWDTDYVLLPTPHSWTNLHSRLIATDKHYADVSYGEDPNNLYSARLLMRARRGLHLKTNHYIYHGPNGDQSWMISKGDEHRALQMLDIKVHHNRLLRPNERLEGRTTFYERRDTLGVEWR